MTNDLYTSNNTNWFVLPDYNFSDINNRKIYEAINYRKNYKVYCGLNVFDSFRITTREKALEAKEKTFELYMNGELNMEGVADLSNIEQLLKTFLAEHCGYVAEGNFTCGVKDLFALYSDKIDRSLLQVAKCIFSTNYWMSKLSRITHPPLRRGSIIFRPKNIKCIRIGDGSFEDILRNYYSKEQNNTEFYMWYEIKNEEDLMCVMQTDNAHLIFTPDELNIYNYDYYINLVHYNRELCAIRDNVGNFADKIAPLLNAKLKDSKDFIKFSFEMIDSFHL